MAAKRRGWRGAAFISAAWAVGAAISITSVLVYADSDDANASESSAQSDPPLVSNHSRLDRSGLMRIGKASFYADRYAGRVMADGTRMDADGNNAASLTLPLGTKARVTNLKTGLSAVVVIRDRGPYVYGRIVDLSPGTAAKIGLDRRTGLAKVSVTPIAIPAAY